MQEEVAACNGRCDGGVSAKHISSISADQGEARTPQEEGGCHIKTASEIDSTVLLQVIIITLRPD